MENAWRETFSASAVGRARSRHCAPAIFVPLFGSFIYRSSSLVQRPEVLSRSLHLSRDSKTFPHVDDPDSLPFDDLSVEEKSVDQDKQGVLESHTLNKIREADSAILRRLGISDILDFMVEDNVTLYHLIPAVSSEKVPLLSSFQPADPCLESINADDRGERMTMPQFDSRRKKRYRKFHRHQLPCPGIEHHKFLHEKLSTIPPESFRMPRFQIDRIGPLSHV